MADQKQFTKQIKLRSIEERDHDLLHELYAQTRAQELAVVPWTTEQKLLFIQQQFLAQTTDWKLNFNQERFFIILWKKQAVGRFYVEDQQDQLLLVDIVVHANFRKKGIGGFLIRQLLEEAQTRKIPVSLHVEANNWVKEYYLKLGFELVKHHEVHSLMRWQPTS